MKKALSLVLVLALVLGSFSFSFAGTAKALSDVAGTDYEDSVRVLMSLGVVTGYPDGTYKPAGAVTRAEMAALIVRALGLGDTASFVAKSNFSDMPGHWADKYVALIAGKNIVKGYPDGTFKPNAKVSFPEAITMIVRALGYTDGCTSLNGVWPANYMALATDLDITDNVKVIASGTADRGAVAIMLYNALDVPNVTVDKSSMVASKVVLSGSGDSAEYLTLLTKLNVEEKDMAVEPSDVDDDDTLCDLSAYVYAHITVYVNDDDQIIGVKKVLKDDGDDTNYVAATGEYDAGDATVTTAAGKEYELNGLDEETKVYLNGEETTIGDIDGDDELLDGLNVTVYGAYKDGAAKDKLTTIYGIVATAPTAEFVVSSSDVEDIAEAIEDGNGDIFDVTLPTVDDDNEELDMDDIVVKGDVTSLAKIEENDVVTVYASADLAEPDKVTFVVERSAVELKVKKVDAADNEVIAADGTAYKAAYNELNDGVEFSDYVDVENDSDFEIGTTYTAYLDQFGYIVDMEEVDASAGNFAIVLAVQDATSVDDAKIKLYTKDGDTEIFDVTDDAYDTDLSDKATIGAIIEYSTNASGDIDDITVLDTDDRTAVTTLTPYKASSNTYNSEDIASNAVFFDLSGGDNTWTTSSSIASLDEDGWDVLSKLTDDVKYTATYYVNEDGEIEVMLITNSDDSNNNYFAVNKLAKAKNTDGDNVYELTGYANGAAAEKLTTDRDAVYTAPQIFIVKYDGSDIKSATALSSVNSGNVESLLGEGYAIAADKIVTKSGTGDYFKTADGVINLADDAVIYVAVYDDGELDSYKAGSISDIDRGDKVTYILNDDGDVELIVVINQADL